MITKSQEILKQANIIPFLKLANKIEGGGTQGTGPHKVKFLGDAVKMGKEYQTGKERHEMEYLFEENGEKKRYRVPVKDKNNEIHYLIQRLAEYNIGDEMILEYKRKGLIGYIEVKPVSALQEKVDKTTAQIQDQDIPVIEEGERTGALTSEEEIDPANIPF